ncbi:ParA family protein [Desulfococcaceae bacterium HSG9]|nr:ParA family protein [Desulfococcaceae bacterium HSG9]
MESEKTRIIAVANEKGGVGKTVTVLNLGAALYREGKTVLIVDIDPQRNATEGMGIEPDEKILTSYDILVNSETIDANEAIIHTQWEGLDIIPSDAELVGADIELYDQDGREEKLQEGLKELTGKYDFILIDTPPSLSLLTVNVFAYADEVLIPCQTHPYSFNALAELFDTIDMIEEEINPGIRITGIIATFFNNRTKVSRNVMEKIQADEKYKDLLFKTKIRINTTIADSAEAGMPVVFYKPGSYGAKDYNDLAEELLQR